ncbi:16S rRNA (cytosine(1402)-N(4))-methyltransferase RsmH [Candidatus Parabeggiatoa sp. HSG14]|uniref:16S rRNA (cytosine(1402)-N(4))-methyltransferase RsmH n=1 Tax=Candidatus Parabeggiatoa sp. HSG14 TaxID=3055593 RepID=UPI0025A712BA|nr:16S rRNA (cytosine(1402)-N(4))-methyltransferase RsmH [Thiotrichales bacterium HSG14]
MSKHESLKLFPHQPVLLPEVLQALNLCSDGIYVDCTFGRGGHTQAILNALGAKGQVLAFDQDPDAVRAAQSLCHLDSRFSIIHSAFAQLIQHVERYDLRGKVNGVLLDLGVSSPQLDTPVRGFSFMRDGPLDMRMNPEMGDSVEKWLSHATANEIASVLKTYGEERHAQRIARTIVENRKQTELKTTRQLADMITTVYPTPFPSKKKDKHPATRSFQALRIFINHELEQLQQVLPQVVDVLVPGGRLVVISFHSLEDRIVKRFIRDCVRGDNFPPNVPVTSAALCPLLRVIGKPIFSSVAEISTNPRARSAVMRVAEKIKNEK